MRRAAKIDGNQGEIVDALRAIGCSVDVSGSTNGFPDLVVGIAGLNILMEVKDGSLNPSERKLTPKQKEWHRNWRGRAHVVESCQQAVDIVQWYTRVRGPRD